MNYGTCLCGDIAWEVGGDFSFHVNCHCSICRKVHGSDYVTFVAASKDNFRWLSGEDKISSYASSEKGERPFCPRCGSSVAAIIDGNAFMPAGNIDGDIDRPLDSHIFVADKASWYEITDEAPRYEGYPPGHDAPETARPERHPQTEGAVGGSCDCGKVVYEFDGPAARMGYCHCSRCRKARSAAYSAQAFVPTENFRWLSGEDNLRHFKLPDSRYFITTFCIDCSSPMPRLYEEFGVYLVPAGSLDDDPGIRPEAHIYVGSNAPWHRITDDLPQFEEMPPG
jgi:hypothetical protein